MADASIDAAQAFPAISLAAWEAAERDQAVIIADGHDIRVQVRAGHLAITDGPPGQPRVRRIARQPRTVSRLLVLAGHGLISAEAIRWLSWAQIPWSMFDMQDQRITAISGPARTDARLLRAQAYAPHEETGLRVTRDLMTAKLRGQAANLRDVLRQTGAARMVDEYADEIPRCTNLEDCRTIEGQAAVAYWGCWAEQVAIPFSPRELPRVPEHWQRFQGRTSMRWDYPSNLAATDPANAMLNYAYRIAESEAVHACHSLGLSPVLGILHADKAGRDSMALDLIEAVRPYADRLILAMLDCGLGVPYTADGKPRYLDRRWFTESYEGQCWLVPPLTHELASNAADIGATLRPHAESAARILAGAASGEVRIPRARKARPQSPAWSKRPARLRSGITADELLPAGVYAKIEPLIPAPPRSPMARGKRSGRPVDTSRDREIIGALAAHELLNVPWSVIPVEVSSQTCQARLKYWTWIQVSEGRSAWDAITEIILASGYLRDIQQTV